MKATIHVSCEGGATATLRLTNDDTAAARVENPGNAQPTDGWPHSREAYRAAVLRSFDILSFDVRDASGQTPASRDVMTNANHLSGVPIELAPGDTFQLPVPLHEFYALSSGVQYTVAMSYGEADGRFTATQRFQC